MINNKLVTAIILVAGKSTRYGQNRNKNFEVVNGRTILAYSLKIFEDNKYVDDIIIAINENEKQSVEKIIEEESINKKVKLILGGNTRKESVYNCIINTNSDIVIIHDGARPVIKPIYVNNCIETIFNEECKGVSIGVKSKDTIKITNESNIVINTTFRPNTWIVQTPQCFAREILLEVHNRIENGVQATDDCMLLEQNNYPVKMIEGDYTNIKVTTFEDIQFVKEFLNK